MQREPFEFIVDEKRFLRPAVLLGGGFQLAQHGVDVNPLAVIAAVVFAEFLHAGNVTQRRKDAKKFMQQSRKAARW